MLDGCGFPRDSDHTLDRVRGREIRVGVSEHPPWTVISNGAVEGIEPGIVDRIARGMQARASYRRGAESELLEALERRELDLVVAGLTDDSPWKGRVALTKPYDSDPSGRKHVFAVAPGENAWLVEVERQLLAHTAASQPGGDGAGR